ncbi:uncharacterized protein LOC6560476 [Drosophila grimshawi]|uniref:GH22078 n=1 Tax=Drosophila grimshawi TaxID=7222 RepID=B4J9Z4_DROGR|nr:uncharacterized protein LOC6560476 [Drosophila grimshawi]EDW02581.1 GH22078 [Drosophila grimshawi]
MDEKLTDPMVYTIDEIRDQFRRYTERCAQNIVRMEKLCLNTELKDINQSAFGGSQVEANAIEDLPASMNDAPQFDVDKSAGSQLTKEQQQQRKVELEGLLVISCGSSECLFDNCRRRVDSQLLLLHYLCDHNDEIAAANRCHQLREGQRVVLSLEPRRCQLKQNEVIGLLAYAGTLMQQHQQLVSPVSLHRNIYNSFLPQQHTHLKCDVPIVVLICKTSAIAALRDKELAHRVEPYASPTDQVFVIWLVTPHNELQLNATLCLYGRDAAIKASSIVAVRQVRQTQDTCQFMPVDANYWRLSFTEMQRISNDFRDELYLEVSLTELSQSRSD